MRTKTLYLSIHWYSDVIKCRTEIFYRNLVYWFVSLACPRFWCLQTPLGLHRTTDILGNHTSIIDSCTTTVSFRWYVLKSLSRNDFNPQNHFWNLNVDIYSCTTKWSWQAFSNLFLCVINQEHSIITGFVFKLIAIFFFSDHPDSGRCQDKLRAMFFFVSSNSWSSWPYFNGSPVIDTEAFVW
jgi:hypothetical protein